jgi:hypothetical protein
MENTCVVNENYERRVSEWVRGNSDRICAHIGEYPNLSYSAALKKMGIHTNKLPLFRRLMCVRPLVTIEHREKCEKTREVQDRKEIMMLYNDVCRLRSSVIRINATEAICVTADREVKITPIGTALKWHVPFDYVDNDIIRKLIFYRRYSVNLDLYYKYTGLVGGEKQYFVCKSCDWVTDFTSLLMFLSVEELSQMRESHYCRHCSHIRVFERHPFFSMKFVSFDIYSAYVKINCEPYELCSSCKGKLFVVKPLPSAPARGVYNRCRRLVEANVKCRSCYDGRPCLEVYDEMAIDYTSAVTEYISRFKTQDVVPIDLRVLAHFDLWDISDDSFRNLVQRISGMMSRESCSTVVCKDRVYLYFLRGYVAVYDDRIVVRIDTKVAEFFSVRDFIVGMRDVGVRLRCEKTSYSYAALKYKFSVNVQFLNILLKECRACDNVVLVDKRDTIQMIDHVSKLIADLSSQKQLFVGEVSFLARPGDVSINLLGNVVS